MTIALRHATSCCVLAITALECAALMTTPAFAQETPPEATGQLDEILVTARRTTENLQDVPLAVTVLGSEAIRSANINVPQDLASKVPSLTTSTSTTTRDAAIYTIRGQSQAFGGSEPAVVTYFAEVPTVVTGPGLIFDLSNIQVLKGPQGTLFGRNTTGGAVLLEPQRPTTKTEGYVDITAGDYNLIRMQAAVNYALADDRVLIRGAVDINRRDGFTKDVVTGVDYDDRDYQAYRLGVTLRPFEGFETYTVLNYAKSDTNGSGTALMSVDPTSIAAFAFPTFVPLLQDQLARGPRKVIHSTPGSYDRVRSLGITNISTLELTDALTLKNVFGFRRFTQRNNSDIDGSALPLVDYVASPFNLSGSASQASNKSYSEELQLQGRALDDTLKWVIGGYALWINPDSKDDKDPVIQFGGPVFFLQSLKYDRSRAVFGQFDYDLSGLVEGLQFTGGIRYTSDRRKQVTSQFVISPAIGCALPVVNPTCTEVDRAKFHATTWNASIQYQFSPTTLAYVSARRGYKSGGFNGSSLRLEDRSFKPEHVQDFEIGLKSDFELGDMKTRLNIAAYRGKFTDIQQNATVNGIVDGQNKVFSVTRNFARGIIQGVEVEYTIIPVDGLNVSGFYAYTDAYYTRFLIPSATGFLDLSNLPFSNSPKHKVGLNLRYDVELGDAGELSLGGSYTYQSKVYFQVPSVLPVITDPQFGQDGYSLLNLRADLNNISGSGLDLGVFVTNVTNKTYKIVETQFYPTPVGSVAGLYGEPRMFGAQLRYNF